MRKEKLVLISEAEWKVMGVVRVSFKKKGLTPRYRYPSLLISTAESLFYTSFS